MKQSARLRASGVLLAVLGLGLSCLVLDAIPDARPCCSGASCQAMLASRCCDASSNLPSGPTVSTLSQIADRIELLTPRWVETSRTAPASREPGIAFGIRTTVLRL